MGREEGGTAALFCVSCVVCLYILACAWAIWVHFNVNCRLHERETELRCVRLAYTPFISCVHTGRRKK